MAATEVKMKLLVDTKRTKVLFAEVGKECADFLFHILSLPIGTVIRLLNKKEMVGSVANLYLSIENLNETYLQPHQTKEMLLKPKLPASSNPIPLLFLPHDVPTTARKKIYLCPNEFCSVSDCPDNYCPICECDYDMADEVQYIVPPGKNTGKFFYTCPNDCGTCVSDGVKALCSSCGSKMSKEVEYIGKTASATKTSTPSKDVGIVKGVVTYMVMDNLEVKPMSTISSITLLNQFNVKNVSALQEMTVVLTMDKALKLLELSLKSCTVLTDVFLP